MKFILCAARGLGPKRVYCTSCDGTGWRSKTTGRRSREMEEECPFKGVVWAEDEEMRGYGWRDSYLWDIFDRGGVALVLSCCGVLRR